jgi:hypothetical protein
MHILHVGKFVIRTPYCDLRLNNVLHVPQASKKLASIHRIATDNNVFFKLHPNVFLSRIRSGGEYSFKADLEEDSTHSL